MNSGATSSPINKEMGPESGTVLPDEPPNLQDVSGKQANLRLMFPLAPGGSVEANSEL
jgi:hypothetical protein